MGIYGLTQAMFQIPFGMAADAYGRKKVIVLGLILFDGLTLAGAAEQLRTPLATLKTRALRAMKQLRRDLRAEIRELM